MLRLKTGVYIYIYKVKVSQLQAMKAHGGCGCKGPHIHSHGTRKEVGLLVLCLAVFTPGNPRYSYYRILSGPLDQSGHEGVKKNLYASDSRYRTRAVQSVAKLLAV